MADAVVYMSNLSLDANVQPAMPLIGRGYKEALMSSFPDIDRFIQEPARLAILTVLSSCRSADSLFLQNARGLSKSNLSVQLSKLDEVGLIQITKEIIEKKTRTAASLSKQGAVDLAQYWKSMETIRRQGGVAKGHRFTPGFAGVGLMVWAAPGS